MVVLSDIFWWTPCNHHTWRSTSLMYNFEVPIIYWSSFWMKACWPYMKIRWVWIILQQMYKCLLEKGDVARFRLYTTQTAMFRNISPEMDALISNWCATLLYGQSAAIVYPICDNSFIRYHVGSIFLANHNGTDCIIALALYSTLHVYMFLLNKEATGAHLQHGMYFRLQQNSSCTRPRQPQDPQWNSNYPVHFVNYLYCSDNLSCHWRVYPPRNVPNGAFLYFINPEVKLLVIARSIYLTNVGNFHHHYSVLLWPGW